LNVAPGITNLIILTFINAFIMFSTEGMRIPADRYFIQILKISVYNCEHSE